MLSRKGGQEAFNSDMVKLAQRCDNDLLLEKIADEIRELTFEKIKKGLRNPEQVDEVTADLQKVLDDGVNQLLVNLDTSATRKKLLLLEKLFSAEPNLWARVLRAAVIGGSMATFYFASSLMALGGGCLLATILQWIDYRKVYPRLGISTLGYAAATVILAAGFSLAVGVVTLAVGSVKLALFMHLSKAALLATMLSNPAMVAAVLGIVCAIAAFAVFEFLKKIPGKENHAAARIAITQIVRELNDIAKKNRQAEKSLHCGYFALKNKLFACVGACAKGRRSVTDSSQYQLLENVTC